MPQTTNMRNTHLLQHTNGHVGHNGHGMVYNNHNGYPHHHQNGYTNHYIPNGNGAANHSKANGHANKSKYSTFYFIIVYCGR